MALDLQRMARRKLRMLNNAQSLTDLRIPPGNRLEALRGNRGGQHSLRINDQWRSVSSGGTVAPTTWRSWTTTDGEDAMAEQLPNIHPGEILLEEFLQPMGISQNRLAREIKVPPRRVNEIVLGKRAITPDTALRLARYFGTSERFWLGLQVDFDLEEAKRGLAAQIDREVKPMAPAA
jgi:addiction module HigA family antidote